VLFVVHITGGSIMEGPVYKFFRVRFTEAWYQLSQAEKDNLMAKVEELGNQFGIKRPVLCNSSWSNERWDGFGVEEFPDMASVQKHNAGLAEINWFRYIDCETMLGNAMA
jgi:hypothetical protein